jgi:hypothetical protein
MYYMPLGSGHCCYRTSFSHDPGCYTTGVLQPQFSVYLELACSSLPHHDTGSTEFCAQAKESNESMLVTAQAQQRIVSGISAVYRQRAEGVPGLKFDASNILAS